MGLQWIKSIIIAVVGGFLITMGFIAFPAANGIVTKHLSKSEQGIGFAVIYAVRSLTWIIAPITFAETYSIFKARGVPSMVMFCAAFLLLMVVIVILFPLRRVMLKTERTGRKYAFSSVELQMIDDSNRKGKKQDIAMKSSDRFD